MKTEQENEASKDRHIVHLEDDVMRYRNFLKELHEMMHHFEGTVEEQIIKRYIEGGE